MRIENWSIVTSNPDSHQPPECMEQALHGKVFGHTRFEDGTSITTSSIIGKNVCDEILTSSGSSYELGQIDPDYEEKFPGAKQRFLNSLTVRPLLVSPCKQRRKIGPPPREV